MVLRGSRELRKVIYRPFPNCPPELIEEGVLTSSDGKYFYVMYEGSNTSKATNPKDVDFA